MKIDKMRQNSLCRIYGNKDETINHLISECSKQVPKEYKIKHKWVGLVICWELRKKLKFDHTT